MKPVSLFKTFFLVAATLMVCTLPLAAQQKGGAGPKGEHRGPHHGMEGLNLTEEQKIKLQELHVDHNPIMVKVKESMKLIRQKSKKELLKDKPDKALLKKYSQETAEQHRIMADEMTNHLLKVKKILSKEQFEKLLSKEFRQDHFKHMKHKGEDPHNKPQKVK